MSDHRTDISDEIQDTASTWLSRRDRGLTPAEQDAYLEWLYRDPLHGRAIVQLEHVWATLDKLEQWRPAHSAIPNPDLLAPRRPSHLAWWATSLATAAVLALGFYLWPLDRSAPPAPPAPPRREAIIHPGPEKLTLADGSIVELNRGAKVEAQFTAAERRVRLLAGEAYFTVAHDAAHPFFVDTSRVSVRAVGTAFSVTLAKTEVGVLVTEGKVQVLEQGAGSKEPGGHEAQLPGFYLTANQRAVVSLVPEAATPVAQDITPADMERALSWQAMRLEFVEMPLGDVVAEFNRYNQRKIRVGDAATAAMLVGGNFRADNIEAFVRLLEAGFGVTVFRHADEIVLRKTQ